MLNQAFSGFFKPRMNTNEHKSFIFIGIRVYSWLTLKFLYIIYLVSKRMKPNISSTEERLLCLSCEGLFRSNPKGRDCGACFERISKESLSLPQLSPRNRVTPRNGMFEDSIHLHTTKASNFSICCSVSFTGCYKSGWVLKDKTQRLLFLPTPQSHMRQAKNRIS